jgi:uncharacterized membrane protein
MGRIKKTHIVFIVIFSVITILQAFFWLFANYAEPIVLGMPFAMFFIVSLIIIEFIALLFLFYLTEVKPNKMENN